jgi:hypothetical protein
MIRTKNISPIPPPTITNGRKIITQQHKQLFDYFIIATGAPKVPNTNAIARKTTPKAIKTTKKSGRPKMSTIIEMSGIRDIQSLNGPLSPCISIQL